MNAVVQGFPIFMLIFCRITAFFVVAPIFSSRGVPNVFKIGIGFFLTLMVFLSHGLNQPVIALDEYVLVLIREILIGLLLGFIVYLFFSIVQTAGGLADMQMGFAMANIVDPHTGASAPLIGNFKYMLMIVVFLMMNGHHYLLNALMNSYRWIPLSNELFARMAGGSITDFLIRLFGNSFLLALQVGAPLMAAMFLADLGLGFLTKTAPQFNVFVVGIPLKLLLGLFLLFLLVPSLAVLFEKLFAVLFQSLEQLIGIIQGPPGA